MSSSKNRPGKTAYRFLRWSLGVVLVLFLLVIVAVELMPWNFLKGPISERVASATGRELVIGGDISISLLPQPRVTMEELAFANADWAQTPDMLTVERLLIRLSLMDLVRGNLVLDRVDIAAPIVNLESRQEQPGNWVLPAMNQQQNDVQQTGPPFTIDDIQVSGAEVRYREAGTTTPHVLSLSELELSGNRLSLQARATIAGNAIELPVEFSARASMGIRGAEWQLSDIDARFGDTRIRGQAGLDTGSEPAALTAELHSPSINVTDILSAWPDGPESSGPAQIPVPVLPVLAGDIRVTVDEIILQQATVSSLESRIRPGRNQLSLESLHFAVADGEVEAAASLTSNDDFIEAAAEVRASGVDLHSLGIGQQAGQILESELAVSLERFERIPRIDPGVLLTHLDIETARASYRTPDQEGSNGMELEFLLEETGEPPSPRLSVNGRFRGQPIEATITGEPLPGLADDLADYRWQARAQSGQLSAQSNGSLGAVLAPRSLSADFVLEGSGQALEAWIGPEVSHLPEFQLSGSLHRDQDLWSVTSLDGSMGDTGLSGELRYRTAERPVVSIELDAGRVELARFLPRDGQPDTTEGTGHADAEEAASASPLAALRRIDGDLNLSVETLLIPDTPELTDLQLTATLESGRVAIEPLDVDIAGGSLTGSATLDASAEPAYGTIVAGFDTIALSRFGDTISVLEERLGLLSGELHLDITETPTGERRGDLLLPFIGRLTVEPSWLRFTDRQADTDLRLDLQTRGLDGGEQAFHIDGEGQYDGAPFSLRFRGDRLLDARDPDRPYELDVLSDVVDSRIHVTGSILQPLALKGLDLELDLSGPNTQRLSRLLGIPFPDLPPYSVTGNLDLEEGRWSLTDMTGTVGNSDLGGRLALDTGTRPPHMSGDLQSESLDIEDLGVLIGADPETPEQGNGEGTDADRGRRYILPDQRVVTSAWQEISADIRYRGAAVRAADIPLSDVMIDFELVDGHGRFDPVRFGVGEGRVDFNIDMDTGPDTPEGTMQLEMRGVDLQKALRDLPLASESVGTVGAQGKFWLTGSSVAELLGSADGGLVMLMSEGQLDALLVELAGLDVTQFFLSWIRARDPIPINCSYLDLQTRDGVATIDTLAVDTADTRFTGAGTVDMNTERVDITIQAHPKDFSVLSVRTPLHLGGTFADMEPGLLEGELGLRAGGSAVLAALAAPVAALIPLLDLGTGEDLPYCEGLASRSLEAIDEAAGNDGGGDRNEN